MRSRMHTWTLAGVAALIATTLLPSAVAAQRERVSAVVRQGSIGVLVPMSPRWAIRPFTWYQVQRNSQPGIGSATTGQLTLGLGTLHYLGDTTGFRPYLAPSFSQIRSFLSGADDLVAHTASVTFGAQARVVRRLSVFGETGLSFSYSERRFTGPVGDFTAIARSGGITGGVGINIGL